MEISGGGASQIQPQALTLGAGASWVENQSGQAAH